MVMEVNGWMDGWMDGLHMRYHTQSVYVYCIPTLPHAHTYVYARTYKHVRTSAHVNVHMCDYKRTMYRYNECVVYGYAYIHIQPICILVCFVLGPLQAVSGCHPRIQSYEYDSALNRSPKVLDLRMETAGRVQALPRLNSETCSFGWDRSRPKTNKKD